MLANVSILRSLYVADKIPTKVSLYCETFEALNSIVEACFGQQLLPNYEQKIATFREKYLSLGGSVTSKAHILFDYVAEFIKFSGKSLSIFSEQTAEAAHADFDGYWQRYKVRDVNHPNLGKNLLKCVIDYNGNHC